MSSGRSARRVAAIVLRPVQAFVATEAASGIVLLAATIFAIAWANSEWDGAYRDLWTAHVGFDTPWVSLRAELVHAVNDGLMAIFFFLVGLEIKRELLEGELASRQKAALPVAAALGGMVVPALIYAAWNAGGDGRHGWGIPMATDIAFALGVLALLGKRAPFALKVFLLALAIVDDLGAIAVIAVFYTESLSLVALGWAVVVVALILAAQRTGIRAIPVYVVLGGLLWLAIWKSGIHATIAGVALAALAPLHLPAGDPDDEPPLDRVERLLHPWVSFLIVPIFALANAGIPLSGDAISDAGSSAVTAGVALGLIVGKPIGIVLFAWLATRLRLGVMPEGIDFLHIVGVGLLAGIGFTVSLFVTSLAFDSVALQEQAKIGILAASALSGLAGFVYLWIAPGEETMAQRREHWAGEDAANG